MRDGQRIDGPRDKKHIRRDARGRFARAVNAAPAPAEAEQGRDRPPRPQSGNAVRVDLMRVHIPAMSTVGYGYGRLEDGTSAVIVGDQPALSQIGQAIAGRKPPIPIYAEVVATGEVADDIAEQWNDQWAISDTEGR